MLRDSSTPLGMTSTLAPADEPFRAKTKRAFDLAPSCSPEILQINVGKLCNLTCIHCHVNAGPKRKEIMTRETIDRIIDWLAKTDIPTVDLTGGAPEMIPDFRYLIERVKALHPSRHIIDRCNLTILLEPGYEDLANFSRATKSRSSPRCRVTRPKTSTRSGAKAFSTASIKALQLLNSLGYGIDPRCRCISFTIRTAPFFPPQEELEADYKRELKEHFGIVFNNLYTITNLPIARFALPATQQSARRLHGASERRV